MRAVPFFFWWSLTSFAAGGDFVDLRKYDATILQDLRYATENNFTKKQVYPPDAKCLLRKPVAEALAKAQAILRIQNYRLKVYDCYRPLTVQKKFWEILPDERYVADPAKGSRHNRGAAVDLTLVDSSGNELVMPSAFDDFSEKAHRVQKTMNKKAKRHMKVLEKAMVDAGFVPFETEWWHFDFKGWESFEIADVPFSDFP